MTTTIYKNPYVFEKHGTCFSEYIALCIKHHKDEKGENTEFHHIFPEHKGGTNHRWNKVHLEYELHIEAHRLLMKAFPDDDSMKSAYNWTKNRGPTRGENNWMTGRTGDLAPNFGNTFTHTDETKIVIGETHRGKVISPEQIAKYRESRCGQDAWNKGKTDIYTEETLSKMKDSALARQKIKCEYCGEEFSPGMYARWHGENCKTKDKDKQ
jgi:hypothetical protein